MPGQHTERAFETAIEHHLTTAGGYEDLQNDDPLHSDYGTPFDGYGSELAPYADEQMQVGYDEDDGMMADEFEQPMDGLEAMVQDTMLEPEEPMQDMMEPEPFEQPMPEDEMMRDPWQMPGGFGPGFGPQGPMPF